MRSRPIDLDKVGQELVMVFGRLSTLNFNVALLPLTQYDTSITHNGV